MTWQEELRRLDSDLADGLISTDQHRLRQEEILAQASGVPASSTTTTSTSDTGASPNTAHTSGSEQDHGAGQETTPGAAEPEAPSRSRTSPGSETGQHTPGSTRSEALLDTDRSTTAPSPADSRATDSVAHPGVQPAAHVPPRAPAPMPSATRPTPPRPAGPATGGPTPASPPVRRRRSGRIWALVSGTVVIVAALVALGFWWFVPDRDTTSGHPVATTPAESSDTAVDQDPTESTTEAEDLAERLPTLPGEASGSNGTISVDKGAEIGLYSDAAGDFLTENDVQEVTFHRSSEGDGEDYLVLLIPTSHQDNAHDVVTFLRDSEIRAGRTETESGVTGSNETGRMSGTWYTSDNVAIALWVSQPLDSAPEELEQRLDDTRQALHESFPEE